MTEMKNKGVAKQSPPELSSLELEYGKVHSMLRYLLEYRTKIFNFSMVFSSALLTLIVVYIPKTAAFAKVVLATIGFVASLVSLLAERRTIYVFYQYLTYAKSLEKTLRIGVLSAVRSDVEYSRISLRRCFAFLYILLILIWPAAVVYSFFF